MPRKSTFPYTLIWVFLFLAPLPARAQNPSLFQELGGSFLVSSSDLSVLPNPRGFRLTSFWSFGDAWLTRLSYQRLSDAVKNEGLVCRRYVPNVGCQTELTEVTSTLSSLQGALMRVIHRGSRDRIALGGGLSFNQLNADRIGESGLQADLFAPYPGQLGFLGTLSLAVLLSRSVPIVLESGFTAHWIRFHHCSVETPRRYDPFCKPGLFQEFDLGLSYLF